MSDNVSAFSDRPADPAKTGRLALKLTNPIEKLAAFLPEVGDPIIAHAQRVEAQVAALAQARANVTQREQAFADEREALRQRVAVHYAKLADEREALRQRVAAQYVDSEIETADVKCTQRLFSGTDGGEGV